MFEKLTRLFVKPRDIIVVTVGSMQYNIFPSKKDLDAHGKRWKAFFPNHEVIVKGPHESIEVIKK
jgi:hypothetical protein